MHNKQRHLTQLLIRASQNNDIDEVKRLVKKINHVDYYKDLYGNTALIMATAHSNADIVKTLIESGANPLCKNRQGKSAYSIAAPHEANIMREAHNQQIFKSFNKAVTQIHKKRRTKHPRKPTTPR